jgi:hypothetical protein
MCVFSIDFVIKNFVVIDINKILNFHRASKWFHIELTGKRSIYNKYMYDIFSYEN